MAYVCFTKNYEAKRTLSYSRRKVYFKGAISSVLVNFLISAKPRVISEHGQTEHECCAWNEAFNSATLRHLFEYLSILLTRFSHVALRVQNWWTVQPCTKIYMETTLSPEQSLEGFCQGELIKKKGLWYWRPIPANLWRRDRRINIVYLFNLLRPDLDPKILIWIRVHNPVWKFKG